MAVKTEYVGPVSSLSLGHPVDIGAPYFTVRESLFAGFGALRGSFSAGAAAL